MSFSEIIAIISGIVSLISFLYTLLIGSEPLTRVLPAILKNPRVVHFAKSLSAVAAVTLIFVVFIVNEELLRTILRNLLSIEIKAL